MTEWSEQSGRDLVRLWIDRIGPAWPGETRGTDEAEAAWTQTDIILRAAWSAKSMALVERAMADFAAVCEREYDR